MSDVSAWRVYAFDATYSDLILLAQHRVVLIEAEDQQRIFDGKDRIYDCTLRLIIDNPTSPQPRILTAEWAGQWMM